MENLIAIIKEGKVDNIIVASDELAATLQDETVNVTGQEVGIGHTYANGVFAAPVKTLEEKTAEEKISALIHRRIPAVEAEKFAFKVGKANVTVNMPDEALYVEGIQLAKRGIALDIQRFLSELTTVKFVETFTKPGAAPQPKKKTKKETTKKAEKKSKKKAEKKGAKETS